MLAAKPFRSLVSAQRYQMPEIAARGGGSDQGLKDVEYSDEGFSGWMAPRTEVMME